VLRGVDPSPVPAIDRIKAELAETARGGEDELRG
jgi:hypothetical protein